MPAPKTTLVPWPMEEPLPSLLTDAQLMRVVQLRPAMFYRLKRERKFDRLMDRGQLLPSTRYSGELVDLYRRGLPISQFGKRARHRKAIVVGKPAPAQYDRH